MSKENQLKHEIEFLRRKLNLLAYKEISKIADKYLFCNDRANCVDCILQDNGDNCFLKVIQIRIEGDLK